MAKKKYTFSDGDKNNNWGDYLCEAEEQPEKEQAEEIEEMEKKENGNT